MQIAASPSYYDLPPLPPPPPLPSRPLQCHELAQLPPPTMGRPLQCHELAQTLPSPAAGGGGCFRPPPSPLPALAPPSAPPVVYPQIPQSSGTVSLYPPVLLLQGYCRALNYECAPWSAFTMDIFTMMPPAMCDGVMFLRFTLEFFVVCAGRFPQHFRGSVEDWRDPRELEPGENLGCVLIFSLRINVSARVVVLSACPSCSFEYFTLCINSHVLDLDEMCLMDAVRRHCQCKAAQYSRAVLPTDLIHLLPSTFPASHPSHLMAVSI